MYAHVEHFRQSESFRYTIATFFAVFLFAFASTAQAATLSFSPASGTYSVGDTISISLNVSSTDQAINAVSGTVDFPADILQAVSVSKANSVLTLWIQEPVRSNADGTVTFAGVVPNPGFTGAGGNIITINFRAKASGTGKLTVTSAETLANDGSGTNVLKGSSSATLTVGEAKAKAKEVAPEKKVTPEEKPVVEQPAPTTEQLQIPIVTNVTKSVALGNTAQVDGSSIYPGATARLTLQGNNGPALTPEAIVGENGVFTITQMHNLVPGDYIGSVVITRDGLQSSPSGAFVIRFEDKPFLSRLVEFLSQPVFLTLFVLVSTFILGFFCGRYYMRFRRHMPMHDTLHEVDVEVHKAFLKLRERVNRSIAELEKESENRELTPAEERFVKEMAGTIKEAEKVIEKEIRDVEK